MALGLRLPRLAHAAGTSRRRRALIAAGIPLLVTLTGCAGPVVMTAAPMAKDARCAEVSVRLPATSAALGRRDTNAQATGAWGTPAAILLWCGVAEPTPTTDPCVTVEGIDWIVDASDAPRYRFTTFGRRPAVSVVVDSGRVSGSSALSDLASAVSYTEKVGECLSVSSAQ